MMIPMDEPSLLFHSLHHAHRKRVAEEQAARGLRDLGSPMLLLALRWGEQEQKDMSQREVAQLMRVSPATVAVALRSLERGGYVARRPNDRDARRNCLALTDRGRWAVDQCDDAFHAIDKRMLSGFSPEEIDQLNAFHLRMLQNLRGDADCPFDTRKERPHSW